MQAHPNLKGKDLASAVDEQSWDPSIKALTQFPLVLANMDKNLSWTSALGEAYINQQESVMKICSPRFHCNLQPRLDSFDPFDFFNFVISHLSWSPPESSAGCGCAGLVRALPYHQWEDATLKISSFIIYFLS